MTPQAARHQKGFLIEEFDVSFATIEGGLKVLQQSRFYGRDLFVFLTLLASGLERLMKIILHLHALETIGASLTESQMREYGHGLCSILADVVQNCYTQNYLQRPVAQADLAFIQNDPRLTEMLSILDDFARTDRYIYMDAIANPNTLASTPQERWEKLEAETMAPGAYVKTILAGREKEAISHANRTLIICLERFVRALTRLFVLGDLGAFAPTFAASVSDFSMLDDDELGMRDYSVRPEGR